MSKNTGSVQERTCAGSARSRRFQIEFGIPNEIIRKYSETAWKFGLCHFLGRKKCRKLDLIILNGGKRCGNLDCHFLCRKKCGNLNFVIFYVGKSAENWTLLFLLAKKVQKVGLCHFYWWKKLGKLNLIIFNGGQRCGKLDFVIFDGGKVWKIVFAIFYG
jgi:hypothetical protein